MTWMIWYPLFQETARCTLQNWEWLFHVRHWSSWSSSQFKGSANHGSLVLISSSRPADFMELLHWNLERYCLFGGLEHSFYCYIYIYIHTHIGNNDPNWLSYFSEGVKPPTSCVLHLLQATKLRFQHVSTKPWRFFFNGCPKDFQIIHLGCHLCFGSQGLRGVIPHQNESRIEKCSNIYHSNIFFWAASNDAVCAAFFGTLFGGPLGPPVSSATAVPRPILVPPSATWFVRTTPWRRHRFVLRCFLRSEIHWIPIFLGVETARDGQSNQKIIGLTSICIHML